MAEEYRVASVDELPAVAAALVRRAAGSRVVAFYGGMGAGKTTFIKTLCEALGVRDVINSPTFSIVNEYVDAAGRTIHHFDFYRLKRLEEAYDIGLEDYLYSGELCLMEWPELVEPLLPDDTLRVSVEVGDDGTRLFRF